MTSHSFLQTASDIDSGRRPGPDSWSGTGSDNDPGHGTDPGPDIGLHSGFHIGSAAGQHFPARNAGFWPVLNRRAALSCTPAHVPAVHHPGPFPDSSRLAGSLRLHGSTHLPHIHGDLAGSTHYRCHPCLNPWGMPAVPPRPPVHRMPGFCLFYLNQGRCLPLTGWCYHVRDPCIVPFLMPVQPGPIIREEYIITYKKIQSARNLSVLADCRLHVAPIFPLAERLPRFTDNGRSRLA